MKNKEIMEIRLLLSMITLDPILIRIFLLYIELKPNNQTIRLACLYAILCSKIFFAKPHIRMYITCEKSANKLEQTHRWDLQSSHSN